MKYYTVLICSSKKNIILWTAPVIARISFNLFYIEQSTHHHIKIFFSSIFPFCFTIRETNQINVQPFESENFKVISIQKMQKFQKFNSTANLCLEYFSKHSNLQKYVKGFVFLTFLFTCLFLVGCILCVDAFRFVFLMFFGLLSFSVLLSNFYIRIIAHKNTEFDDVWSTEQF